MPPSNPEFLTVGLSWEHALVDEVEISKKTFTAFQPKSKTCQIEYVSKEFAEIETCILCRKYVYGSCLSDNEVKTNVETDQQNQDCSSFWNSEKEIIQKWKTGATRNGAKSVVHCLLGCGLPKALSFVIPKLLKALIFASVVRLFDAFIEKYEPEVDVAYIGAEVIGALIAAFVMLCVALFKFARKRVKNGKLFQQNWDDLKVDGLKVGVFILLIKLY